MIIVGGEPPFVEVPEPYFGKVISSLNALAYKIQAKTEADNAALPPLVQALQAYLTPMVNEVTAAVDAHLNARGAVHGETKSTIGLGKKDNFRTATLAEQQAMANVDAFCTPAGTLAALNAYSDEMSSVTYQQNDLLPFASWMLPRDWQQSPQAVTPQWFQTNYPAVPVVMDGDTALFMPYQEGTYFPYRVLFSTTPLKTMGGRVRLNEALNVTYQYQARGWNLQGVYNGAAKVSLFRPLVDKGIYEYKTNLGGPDFGGGAVGNREHTHAYLMYKGSTGNTYRGLGSMANYPNLGQIDVYHRLWKVINEETDPTLDLLLADNQLTTVVTSQGLTGTPSNAMHSLLLSNFIAVTGGFNSIQLETGGPGEGITTSLFWNARDYEAYFHIACPVKITKGSLVKRFMFTYTESWIPGTRQPGSTFTIKALGAQARDQLDANLNLVGTGRWLSPINTQDFNNPHYYPGIFKEDAAGGRVIRAKATKYGIRVKSAAVPYNTLGAWLTASNKAVVSSLSAQLQVFAAANHTPFGAMPDRIIPWSNTANETHYLSYCVDNREGRMGWRDHTWYAGDILNNVAGTQKGLFQSDNIQLRSDLSAMPPCMSIAGDSANYGFTPVPIALTTLNNFKSNMSVTLTPASLTLGPKLNLATASLYRLQALAGAVSSRGAAANPNLASIPASSQIMVFDIQMTGRPDTANCALIAISDGRGHCEVSISPYTIANNGDGTNTMTLTNIVDNSFVRVSATGQTSVNRGRTSTTGDGVWMSYCDFLYQRQPNGRYQCVIQRPNGDLYGDVSFTITAGNTLNPVITAGRTNSPRFYSNTDLIDSVEELYPAILLPRSSNVGICQNNAALVTNALDTALESIWFPGTIVINPYDRKETGWVTIPAGSRCVIGGRTYIFDRNYSVKTPTVAAGVTVHIYLQRLGTDLKLLAVTTVREPSNTEVYVGWVTNGLFTFNTQYLVLDGRTVNASFRGGSSIPAFSDNGTTGVNRFFKQSDVS